VDADAEPSGAVSWPAVFAGAAAAAALSLLLLMLGVGLGLSTLSPWVQEGASAASLGIASILWIALAQLIASGLGGYIAGRLRTRWSGVHVDEVHFRDTAHGFLAWAIASLAAAAVLTTAIGTIVGAGARTGAVVVQAASTAAAGNGSALAAEPTAYLTDSLFRAAPGTAVPAAPVERPVPTGEVARILANGLRAGALPADDVQYLATLVSARTGLSAEDARTRVTATFAQIQQVTAEASANARSAAEVARRASAHATLWLFISLLLGAFVASLSATFGGRQRDA
jgi:hypothetical protein